MNEKLYIMLASILAFVSLYSMMTPVSVTAIPWAFKSCGDGDWKIETVTLGQVPKRNVNDEIAAVILLIFRPELPKRISPSKKFKSMSSLMESILIRKLFNLLTVLNKEITFNFLTRILSQVSLLQELMDWISNFMIRKMTKMDVFQFPLNYDSLILSTAFVILCYEFKINFKLFGEFYYLF